MLVYDPRKMEWVEQATGQVVDLEAKSPQKRKSRRRQPDPGQLEQTIERHPVYGFARRLANHLYAAYGLSGGPTVFRNIRGSQFRPGTRQLVFGYQSLTASFEDGFTEYVSIASVWTGLGEPGQYQRGYRSSWVRFADGLKGVWMEVLHEFAHVLQHEQGAAAYGDIHNDNFRRNLEELVILFPFEEVSSLA